MSGGDAVSCRELRPLIGAQILGALEPDEAAAVREHVAACADCAAEHARLAPLPGLLTLAAGAEAVLLDPPSLALEERLLDAVAAEAPPRPARRRRRRPPRRVALFGAGAASLAAAAVAVVLVTATGTSAPAPGYPVAFHAAPTAPRAGGHARLEAVQGGTALHLWVSGLPADRAAVYEVLCDAPGWSASAGTFRVDARGRAYVVLTTAARQGQYDAIRVLRRTPGGDRLVLSASLAHAGGAEPAWTAPRNPS
jgi:hypothetical protein